MIRRFITAVREFFARIQERDKFLLIQASGLFDDEWYLQHNPDVAQAKIDPTFHYLRYGGFEGRDPSPNFSSAQYLKQYSDVKQAGINPLVHYVLFGRKEKRMPHGATTHLSNDGTGNQNNLMSSFLSSYLAEIGHNFYNVYGDNYDHNRFGENNEQVVNAHPEDLRDPKILAAILVHSVKDIEHLLPRFDKVFNDLADDESRLILIKLLAYRALGYKKVKLPLNTPAYWEGVKEVQNQADYSNAIYLEAMQWKLPRVHLSNKGFPVTLYGVPFGVFTQFILEHYKYVTDKVNIQVEEADYVIDAGACWGDTALYFANRVGSKGKVFSFEFVPRNLEIFSRNLDLNPHLKDRIYIVKKAVWDISGTKIPFIDGGPGSRIISNEESTGQVETLSIDDWVDQINIARVNFIKMDIEGSELAALQGAVKTIKKYRPKLAISIYHKFLDFLEIPEFILSLDAGYRIYIKHFTIHAEETVLFAEAIDD